MSDSAINSAINADTADTIALPRQDAIALTALLRTMETVLDMDDASVADALDAHFGCPGAIDLLFTAAGMHADTLQALLSVPTEHSQTLPEG